LQDARLQVRPHGYLLVLFFVFFTIATLQIATTINCRTNPAGQVHDAVQVQSLLLQRATCVLWEVLSNAPHVLVLCRCRPPADCCAEFEVERIELPAHAAGYRPVRVNCGSILLLQSGGDADEGVTLVPQEGEGEALTLRTGAVVFTSAGQDVCISTGAGGAVFYRAHVNLG
jgi:hypothetical protein